MAKDIIKSLEKLILPVSESWEITDININDKLLKVKD